MKLVAIVATWLCVSAASAAPASNTPAPAAPQAPAASPAVKPAPANAPVLVSTKAVTPTDLYTGDRLRDPFIDLGGGTIRAGAVVASDEPFNIHALSLSGILQEKGGDFAILVQQNAGKTYILRNGKLLDKKNKPVSGVTGKVHLKQKKVEVETSDKDVQVLILGEKQEGL